MCTRIHLGIDLEHTPAKFILNLLTRQKINQVTAQAIMKQTNNLVKAEVGRTINRVAEILASNGIDAQEHLQDLIASNSHVDHFAGLQYQYQQNRYFVQEFGMIEPEMVDLPVHQEDYSRHRRGHSQTVKTKKYAYIPILKLIERLLSFDDVMAEILRKKKSPAGRLSCFEDGRAYKENKLFEKYPNALQVHLYFDEVMLCDPLASRTKKNKLVFVYFTIGNLEPKFRSSFKMINLVSVFYSHHMNRYGLNVMLRRVIEDLQKLEQGCLMTIHNCPQLWHGMCIS